MARPTCERAQGQRPSERRSESVRQAISAARAFLERVRCSQDVLSGVNGTQWCEDAGECCGPLPKCYLARRLLFDCTNGGDKDFERGKVKQHPS